MKQRTQLGLAIFCVIIFVFGFVFIRPRLEELDEQRNLSKQLSNVEIISEPEPITPYNVIELDPEMVVVNAYIRSKNERLPRIVSMTTAWEIITQCRKNGIFPELVLAIIQVESSFNPSAEGPKLVGKYKGRTAKGLMQILNEETTEGEVNQDRLYDIPYNIRKGLEILKEHVNLNHGDWINALNGYSGGAEEYEKEVRQVIGDFMLYCWSHPYYVNNSTEEINNVVW